jgi:mannose-6-phosphate isomerase-like protein (cupin superfamily)
MAKAGDEIVNPRTGQRMVFLETGQETGGQSVRIDSYNPPSPSLEPEHVHPFQESGAEVISGSLRFSVGGEERSVKAGESITIPANTPHRFWNDGEQEAHSIQSFRPALKIDRFFESYFGLAHDGKLNEEGSPSFWQLAVMVPYFGDEIRTPNPPWTIQRALFGLLAPVGRMLGYRPEYPYPYGERGEEPSVSEGEQGVSASSGARKGAVGGMVIIFALFLVSLLLWQRRRRSRR